MLPVVAILILLFAATGVAQTPSPFLGGMWCGSVTPTTATVAVHLNAPGLRVRLVGSEALTLTSPIFSAAVTTSAATGNAVKMTVQGLKSDTDYYYGVEVGGVVRPEPESRGRLHTFPLGRSSFKIAFAGDSDFAHADQRAFDAILAERPLLFVHLGDLHYHDTNSTNIDDYRGNYDAVLSQPNASALYRGVPVAYMWDDHDFCGNDSYTTAIGRDTARAAYKERVPHYPIGPTGGTIGQAFTVGRVRFIMTDLRSAAMEPSQRESAAKTRMGTAQKAWFKQELLTARDSGFPLILWLCPDPWIARAQVGDDTWGGHATERTEIANFIRDNRISNVTLLSADMHALAFDDGTNSDYATGGGAPLIVLHAAALTAEGSVKGGPYTGGPLPGSQQYGILEIYDNGGSSVACRYLGMKVGEGAKLRYIFSSSAAGARDHELVNLSTLARITRADDVVVSGFVISGNSTRTVLVRAVGPTLAAFGVTDALPRPQLAVFQGDQLVATNEGWAGAADAASQLTDVFDRAGAFRLLDAGSRDAALVLSLPPAAYTVRVKSVDGAPGAALVEVYDLP